MAAVSVFKHSFGEVGEGTNEHFLVFLGAFVIRQGNFITICIMDYDCQTQM